MTTATRDFIIKASSGLFVTAFASFAGAFVGMYVASAKTETQLANIEHEIQRHDVRIERLERRSEDQGRELAKLSSVPSDVKEIREDVKKLLSRKE